MPAANGTSAAADPRPPEQAEPDLTRLVGVKLGNYRLERLIGRGRMGVVYLAKDEALLRPTAIKILSWRVADAHGQDPVQWFLAEARLVARINHPRVVQIYGAAKHGEHCYIAMEYVVGSSADAMIARDGRVDPEVATGILIQAAEALEAAHRSGVIHRDVKPANLLVGEGGVTKLGDFGMALGSAEFRTGNAHLRVGTPYYTAPEIWTGGAATAASDIYSLGATFFHLLTGRPPYPGPDVASVEQGHLRVAVPDPRELAPALPASCAALLARALAKAPRERHPSAQVLLVDARRVMQDVVAAMAATASAVPSTQAPSVPRVPPPPLRRPAGTLADPRGVGERGVAEARAPGARGVATQPLRPHEVGAYLRSRIDLTLARGAPKVLVSPDAVLLVALRSDGIAARIDRLAENMLALAAAERGRTLVSWHAWAASDVERWTGRAAGELPRRPEAWPPPEVVDVIDACRRGAGLPPWPRGTGSRG